MIWNRFQNRLYDHSNQAIAEPALDIREYFLLLQGNLLWSDMSRFLISIMEMRDRIPRLAFPEL